MQVLLKSLVVFLVVNMYLRKVPTWRGSTKKKALDPYRLTPITTSRIKNIYNVFYLAM